jgi:hypothetical protein
MPNNQITTNAKLREGHDWRFRKSHILIVVQKVNPMTRGRINSATLFGLVSKIGDEKVAGVIRSKCEWFIWLTDVNLSISGDLHFRPFLNFLVHSFKEDLHFVTYQVSQSDTP